MTKSKFLFTAILATMISAGAWAYAPGDTTADGSTAVGTDAHDVYTDALPTDAEAGAGIAGVTYVNRVANRAGAAAQAAENHAAHASASASAAQSSADAAAAAAANAETILNGITASDGIVVTDVLDDDDNETVIGKEIAVNPGQGIKIADDGTVAVKPGKGIEIDKDDGTVDVTPGVGIMIKDDQVSVNTGEGLKHNNDGQVAVNPGAGLTFDEQNALTVKPATETELGGLFYAPASVEEAQDTINEMAKQGLNIFNPDDGARIAITYPLAVDLAAQGHLSGAYGTISEANEDFNANKEDTMKLRPLSLWAHLQGQSAERAAISAQSDVSYVNMPSGKDGEGDVHAVGDAARPVYVADSVTGDNKHRGVVTPIESVAIPVGDDDFTGATSTAKIWIQ